ncbi:MAG: nucleoside triphosphate pyrophosphohydrolase [Legionellales bacterium]|nr:nucleoside triphosphate pyrophosphohydrolase [Legionellales bacterium]
MQDLLDLMTELREQCHWTREQDFKSIIPYTIEEAYEVAAAIEENNMPELQKELGDLLYQIVFYCEMAREAGDFDFADIVESLLAKNRDRNPDFSKITTAEEVVKLWETAKTKALAAKDSVVADLPKALPALVRAEKIQRRVATVGFEWPTIEPIFAKLQEEITELQHELDNGSERDRIEDEVGDLLFTCVNIARHLNIDAERALQRSNQKFIKRFRYIEDSLKDADKDIHSTSLEDMETLWQAAKEHSNR